MKAQKILAQAADLVGGERQNDYGPPEENFNRIARLWSVVLKHPVSAHQVALCMAQLKVARLVESPTHDDSWVDGAAYMGLGAQLVEPADGCCGEEVATVRQPQPRGGFVRREALEQADARFRCEASE